ncbi:MAG: hypothetical protein R3E10_15115 [Gemmatimonadota bacterium]
MNTMEEGREGVPRRAALPVSAALVLLGSASLVACGGDANEVQHPPVAALTSAQAHWIDGEEASTELRSLWTHLQATEHAQAGEELEEIATAMREAATGAVDSLDSARLRSSAEELGNVGRDLEDGFLSQPPASLAGVVARAYLALSQHHRMEATAALADDDLERAGLQALRAVRDLESGFRVGQVEMTDDGAQLMERSARAADRLRAGDSTSVALSDTLLCGLRDEAQRLANALGARRR